MKILTKDQFISTFDRLYKDVKNYAFYKSRDVNRAEDAAQEAFVTLWKKRDQLRVGGIEQYLYATAARLITKSTATKEMPKLQFARSQPESPSVDLTDHLEEFNEFERELLDVLTALAEQDRVVFLMNRIDGLKYYEIAQRLGISHKTVMQSVSNALKELCVVVERKYSLV